MEALKRRIGTAVHALGTLQEALELRAPSALERDGAIQRFEYSYETFWKACQTWLRHVEGLDRASPRACLRAIGAAGLMDTAETIAALSMAEDRNDTVHTYDETVAKAIFSRLPGHAALMSAVLGRMQARLDSET